ncbi:hypothetical protein [Sediminicola luteus]|jgi:hypothetical protein|nr:hypothetical protein [Sediminicola luteus]
MENIYSEKEERQLCKLSKASKQTVDFLLQYSKSLDVVQYGDLYFERQLN